MPVDLPRVPLHRVHRCQVRQLQRSRSNLAEAHELESAEAVLRVVRERCPTAYCECSTPITFGKRQIDWLVVSDDCVYVGEVKQVFGGVRILNHGSECNGYCVCAAPPERHPPPRCRCCHRVPKRSCNEP